MPTIPRATFLDPAVLAADIRRLDLRIKDAARVLGVTPRMVQYLKAGQRRITRQQAELWQKQYRQGA